MATEIRYSSTHAVELTDPPLPDVDADPVFAAIFAPARPFSMTHKDMMFALYDAVRYACRRGIPGDIVECGVWKGGSALLAGLALRHFDQPEMRRRLWLYDTFEGMTAPTSVDPISRERRLRPISTNTLMTGNGVTRRRLLSAKRSAPMDFPMTRSA